MACSACGRKYSSLRPTKFAPRTAAGMRQAVPVRGVIKNSPAVSPDVLAQPETIVAAPDTREAAGPTGQPESMLKGSGE